MPVSERLHALLPDVCPPGLVLQALDRYQRALERGMTSDELSQLGNWTTIADQLPLWSGDIELLWSVECPVAHFVCVKVRLKAALVLLVTEQESKRHVTERESNQSPAYTACSAYTACPAYTACCSAYTACALHRTCKSCRQLAASWPQYVGEFSGLQTRCSNTCRSSLITASRVCQSREPTSAHTCGLRARQRQQACRVRRAS